MKTRPNPFLRIAPCVLLAVTIGSMPISAGTIWDAVKNDLSPAANTNIDNAENWDGDVVNAINGTTAASFGTGGSSANMNVPARFTLLTFNRDDAAGFTVGGASALSVNISASSGVQNLVVADTGSNGITTINAPLQVHTTGTTGTRLLNIPNSEDDTASPSLVIAGGLAATTVGNTFNLRFGNTGTTKISGAITGISGIQQHFNQTFGGTAIIAGNQALGNVAVLIGGTGSGSVSSTARIEMGESSTDIQSWGSSTVNQNATLVIKSTATLTGGIDVATATGSGASGGSIEVPGVLSATTLKIGSTAYSGKLKVSGTASFSGDLITGSTAGNQILGNAPSNGTLKLSSGTLNGTSTTIGGANPNENNLNLVKQNSGILTLGGSHTYSGTTTVEAGTLTLTGSILSATTVQSGGLLNISGTTAGSVTVNAGGTVGGEGTLNNTLTFGTGSSSINFDPTTQTGSLTATSVDPSAATIIVVTPTGAVTNGIPYVVLKRATGTFSGADLAKFALGTRGGALSLTGGNTEITLTPAASVPASLVWKGDVSTAWDVATTQNWSNGGSPDRFYSADNVTFDDTATSFTVALAGTVSPGSVLINNTTPNDYIINGGSIGGSGSVTKNGTGLATINSSLAHTGGLLVNSGVLSLGTTNTNTFTGGISLTGGELQFGGTSIAGSLNTQAVTLTGGTLTRVPGVTVTNDSQTFAFNSNGATIKVDGNTNTTWRIGGKISGSGNWTKTGPAILSLGRASDTSPANDFTGTVTVNEGTLDIRHADSLGTTAGGTSVQGAILLMQNFSQTSGSTITVNEPLGFSGAAFLIGYNQENKTFTHQYTGTVDVAAGAVVGISGARNSSGAIVPTVELNDSTITTNAGSVLSFGLIPASTPAGVLASAQTINVGSSISGPGSVTAQGAAGSVYTLSAPGYSGNTTVSSSTLKLDAPNTANQLSSVEIASTNAFLELNFSGTDTVDKLFIGGVQQPAGIYKASDNLVDPGTGIPQITGTGTLSVSSSPVVASGYAVWASNNGIPGEAATDDFDNDGIDNLTEYALGLTPAVPNGAPGVLSGNTITFTKGTDAIANGDVNFIIEASTDLGVSDPWAPVVTQNAPNASTTIAYTFTPGSPARNFARLRTVLVP